MAAILYVLTGIILYVAADWILRRLEHRAGRVFEGRTLIFFGILLALALVTFAAIRSFVDA